MGHVERELVLGGVCHIEHRLIEWLVRLNLLVRLLALIEVHLTLHLVEWVHVLRLRLWLWLVKYIVSLIILVGAVINLIIRLAVELVEGV